MKQNFRNIALSVAIVVAMLAGMTGVSLHAAQREIKASDQDAALWRYLESERQGEEGIDVCKVSPDGRFRAETTGEESLGGRVYPESVQVIDLQNDRILWSDTSYMEPGFLWSENSRYLAIRSSGRTWTDCRLLDCNSWKELPAPNIRSLCELAEAFPPASESGSTAIIPLRWLSEHTLLLEVCWDADPSFRVKGTVEYQVDNQKYSNLRLKEEPVG